jgi:transposase
MTEIARRRPRPSERGKPGSCLNRVFLRGNHMPATVVVVGDCHSPMAFSGVVQVRYRYRLYPSPQHQKALARVFGCARVVFNDSLRLREEAHAGGERLSDSDVQRRVITMAKRTPEREWLSEVPSVALVQACNDARRAYRNWFDSLSGRRKGPKVGHPRPHRKHARQSIRRTLYRIGRFVPTSQTCSACGVKDGPKPLSVRSWQCAACGAVHDRDVNAAINILAAGRADRLNACGGDARPRPAVAVAVEAGTHRSAA